MAFVEVACESSHFQVVSQSATPVSRSYFWNPKLSGFLVSEVDALVSEYDATISDSGVYG